MNDDAGRKKAYLAPRLKRWGSVKDLTRQKAGDDPDGFGGSLPRV